MNNGVFLRLVLIAAIGVPPIAYAWQNTSSQTVTIEWSSSGEYYTQSASGDVVQGPNGESNSGTEVIPPGGYFGDGSYSWSEPGSDGDEIFHNGNITVDNVIYSTRPTVSLSASPLSMDFNGGTVHLTWSSTDADAVESTGGFSAGSTSGSTDVWVGPNGSYTDWATYYFSISVRGVGGIATADVSVTLSPKRRTRVSFDVRPTNFTYNGGSQGPSISTIPMDGTYAVTSGAPTATDAGTYSFHIEATGDFEGSADCTWVIEPKPVSFSFDNLSHTYDGSAKTATVSCSDSGASYTTDLTQGPESGTYTVSAKTVDNTNYAGRGFATLVIAKQAVYCDFSNNPSNYAWTYDGGTKSLWHNSSNNGVVSGSGTDRATDAGTYSFEYTLNDSDNYYFANGNSQTWTIDPKPVSFSFSDLSFAYDGNTHSATVSASDGNADYSTDVTKGPEAGSYTVSAWAHGNYSGSDAATLTIDRGDQSVAVSPASRTIIAGQAVTFTASGGQNGYTWGGSASGSGSSKSVTFPSIGTYTVTVYSAAGGNYDQSNTASAIITVNPATTPTTFAFAPTSFTYDGTPRAPTITPSPMGATYNVTFVGTGSTSYGPSSTAPTNAGTYTVTAIATGNYSGTGSTAMTVAKATPTITWANPAAITYGAALSATQLNAAANVAGSLVYSPGPGTVLGAGARALSVAFTPTDGTNYTLASAGVSLTVNKAVLTVRAADKTRPYATNNPPFTISYSGFVNGDGASAVSVAPTASCLARPASAPGSYAIRPGGGSAANYTFAYVNGTLTVTKANGIVIFTNLTATYDGSPQAATAATGPGDLNVTLTYNGSGTAPTAAGSYTVVGTINDANYQGSATATFTIAKATPVVTWSNPPAITYGTALSAAQLNATASVPGSFVYAPAAGAVPGAGTHALATTFTPADTSNYNPASKGVSLTVNKALLTARADDKSRGYGAANPGLTVSYSGFVNGDGPANIVAPMASTSATATSPVAIYDITVTGGSAANYALNLRGGTLTVTPATLLARADDKTKVFGTDNPPLTITYSGFMNGDGPSSITPPSLTTTAAQKSDVGAYGILLSGGAATNYALGLANGTLTVLPKNVSFTFGNLTQTYDGVAKTATVAASEPEATFTADLTKGPDANTYDVSAQANGNYTGTGLARLVINRKPVAFTFGDLAHVFDGSLKSATVTASDGAATFSADVAKGPSAGTYRVGAQATGNFVGTGQADLVISPAAQRVTLSPAGVTVFVGQPTTFTATGGNGGYVWGGNAGASGSAPGVTLDFAATGAYTLTVYSPPTNDYEKSNTATTTITVVSNHQVNTLVPLESSYTVADASSPMNGQTYRRIWQEGGWRAFLGRSGVRFNVKAQAWPSVNTVELQAKAPGGDWIQLASESPAAGSTSVDTIFNVMLGAAAPNQPLVPASYAAGAPQVGGWSFRARVQDANGAWSDFSPEVPVEVVLPIVTRTVSGQTVPPAGELGKWFTASPVQAFPVQLWIP